MRPRRRGLVEVFFRGCLHIFLSFQELGESEEESVSTIGLSVVGKLRLGMGSDAGSTWLAIIEEAEVGGLLVVGGF